jgi:hypothetical protein
MVGEFQEGWGGRERMIKSCPQMASGPPALLLFGTSDSTPDLRLRLNGELNSHLLMCQD